jgi:hypothetical protein
MSGGARDSADPGALQVRRRQRLGLVGWLLALVVVAAVVGWVSTHPADLPTSSERVTASTPVGTPVYVGVFGAPSDFDRTLHVSGVKIFAVSTVEMDITPWLCRGGSVGVTTTPDAFCSELVDTEGATMRAGDEIVLEVSGEEPGSVAIDPVRVAYRDGFQWATQDAGSAAVVSLLPR